MERIHVTEDYVAEPPSFPPRTPDSNTNEREPFIV